MPDAALAEAIPAHVKPGQVVDYDYFKDPRHGPDMQLSLHALHGEAPDVFWTPKNGGFWVVTRLELMSEVLRDTEHFSNSELDIPKSNSPNRMIPLNLDPPEHQHYRAPLMRHFDRKRVVGLEPKLKLWANRLIDKVIARGECEFTEEIGAGFPVSIFMELMGLPLDRYEQFRDIVTEYFDYIPTIERRIELQDIIIGAMREYFEARRREPQDDLMSRLVEETIYGRPFAMEELESIGFLLFLAGLDTVANTLTFTFHHLAQHPELQNALAKDDDAYHDFVEEALRRFSIVQQTRVVKKAIDFHGASFREGEMINCPLALAGMDETKNASPERFEIERPDRAHLAFSTGAHTCIGNILARAEMRVFTQEWIKRIPRFSLKAPDAVEWRAGGVMALKNVELCWPTP